MIVADANVITYLFLTTTFSEAAVTLWNVEPRWMVPILWRSEFCSTLQKYIQHQIISTDDAVIILNTAVKQLKDFEFRIDMQDVLRLSTQTGCSTYDCEYVVLAKRLGVPFITQDKKVLRIFPDIAMTIDKFLIANGDVHA